MKHKLKHSLFTSHRQSKHGTLFFVRCIIDYKEHVKSNSRKYRERKKFTFLTYILTSRRANNHLLKKRDHNLNKNLLFILRGSVAIKVKYFC